MTPDPTADLVEMLRAIYPHSSESALWNCTKYETPTCLSAFQLRSILSWSNARRDAAVKDLQSELAALKNHLDPQAYLERAGKAPGPKTGYEFAVRSPIVRILANHMAATLKAHGASNYVELGFAHEELGPLTLLVQRDNGDTPARKVAERDAQIARLTEALGQIAAIDCALHGPGNTHMQAQRIARSALAQEGARG